MIYYDSIRKEILISLFLGGTAGCVLANRLSSNGQYTVLVLEAGISTQEDLIESQIPLLNSKLKNTDADWSLKSMKQTEADGRIIDLPVGKLLGGSSAINACLLHRCSPSDYDGWKTEGWAYDDLKSYFRKAENYHDDSVSVDNDVHGTQGPLNATHINRETVLGNNFKTACKNYGLEEYRDMTDMPCQIGVTDMEAIIYQGKRSSAGTSYLPPDIQINRSNLFIGLGCKVTRILMDNENSVSSIEYTNIQEDGKIHKVFVDTEVILSAGAILSPFLLLKSGIGPKDELKKLGMDVKVDLPGVGKNLQNHWRVPIVHETTAQEMSLHRDLFEKEKETLDLAINSKEGALTQLWTDAVAYLKIPVRCSRILYLFLLILFQLRTHPIIAVVLKTHHKLNCSQAV
jgi:choline dehydrogenase